MLIVHNPHTKVFFGQSVAGFLTRNELSKKSQKYRYLLDYLKENSIPFGVYLDYSDSSFPRFLWSRFFIRMELYFWLLIKGIRPSLVTVIDSFDTISASDVFLSFSIKTLDTEYHGLDGIENYSFYKIFHFNHYVQNTSLVIKNFKRLKGDCIIAESDLRDSSYFCSFFQDEELPNTLVLPFTFGSKFKKITPFSERKNACVSTGAIIRLSDYSALFTDLLSFYSSSIEVLQPTRRLLLENTSREDLIISKSSYLVPQKHDRSFAVILKKVLFGSRNDYFRFDIVETYNSYKMFICGEELGDLPGIGFVEGMACGTAYIGLKSPMYERIGLIDGVHYIGHDGTLESIVSRIEYYSNHPEELQKIAESGHKFVISNFSQKTVAENFFSQITRISSCNTI